MATAGQGQRLAGDDDEIDPTDPAQPEADAPADSDADADSATVAVDDDQGDELHDDGSATVSLTDEPFVDTAPPEGESDHFANLAETLDPLLLSGHAIDLLDAIERDKQARTKRDEQYREGLERTGAGKPAPGGADFDGASRTTHPVLMKAAVDFQARVMKEIFPPEGPAKSHILGKPSAKKVEKAQRKADYLNYQLTTQIPEFRGELEQVLTQVPLGGAQYTKHYYSKKLGRQTMEKVWIDDIILPYAASSWLTAERKAHEQRLTEAKWLERIESGQYVDTGSAAGLIPEQTESAKAADDIEGKEDDGLNLDGVRTVYEVACSLDLEETGTPRPYLISIDESARAICAVYRNWEPDDDHAKAMEWIVEWPFIPWRGAYPIGLHHMIGGLAGSATGAIRALLDSAHINNAASAVKLAGGGKGGQVLTPDIGTITEIDGGFNVDDIRKLIMPMPYNQPSPVLFQLLGFLVESAEGVVRTSFELDSDNQDAAVGTTLAMIEQGMTVFSAIHMRMHAAMAQVLAIVARLNRMYMEDEETIEELGEMIARRADFEGPMDIVPVSDPHIFSEAQRMAQVQIIAARAQLFPMLYDLRKVEQLILSRTKIPDADDLLQPTKEPQQMNAVNENAAAAMGKPVTAFPEQHHLAHIHAHLSFLEHPMFGIEPIKRKLAPIMLQHLCEHMTFWYVHDIYERTSQAAGVPVEKLMDNKDPEVDQRFDELMMHAADQTLQEANGIAILGSVPPILAQLQQYVQANAMPPPMDPSVVAAQDVARKSQDDQQKNALESQKIDVMKEQIGQKQADSEQQKQFDAAKLAGDMQRENQHSETLQSIATVREQGAAQRTAATNQTKLITNTQDNITAEHIAGAQIESGHGTNLKDGTGIDPGNER